MRRTPTRLRTAGLERAATLGWGGVADQLMPQLGQIARMRIEAARRPADREQRQHVSAIRLDVVRAPTAQPAPAKAALQICTPVYGGSALRASLPRSCARPSLLPRHGVRSNGCP